MSEKIGLNSSSSRNANLTQIRPPAADPPSVDGIAALAPPMSKKTVRLLAKIYAQQFCPAQDGGTWMEGRALDSWRLYTFLSDHGFDSDFCNVAWLLSDPRALLHFIQRLETGESVRLYDLPTQGQAVTLVGQHYLRRLASILIGSFNRLDSSCLRPAGISSLVSALQEDGVTLPSRPAYPLGQVE